MLKQCKLLVFVAVFGFSGIVNAIAWKDVVSSRMHSGVAAMQPGPSLTGADKVLCGMGVFTTTSFLALLCLREAECRYSRQRPDSRDGWLKLSADAAFVGTFTAHLLLVPFMTYRLWKK